MRKQERSAADSSISPALRLESMTVLASGVAHDLNNVFTPMRAAIVMLQQDSGSSPSARALLTYLDQAIEYSASLCRNMLEHAAGRDALQRVELFELVKGMSGLLAAHRPPGARLHWVPCSPALHVRGDAIQLSQIVFNLVTNAFEAIGSAGGEVTVTLAKGRGLPPNLCVDTTTSEGLAKGHAVIRVDDTGCGMPSEQQLRKVDSCFTTKSSTGHGLGLSIVSALVRRHAGAIRVERLPVRGTRVEVLLPLVSASHVELEPMHSRPGCR